MILFLISCYGAWKTDQMLPSGLFTAWNVQFCETCSSAYFIIYLKTSLCHMFILATENVVVDAAAAIHH